MPGYLCPKSAGKGITIYIIGPGTDPHHEEYTQSPGSKRWLYLSENDKSESDGDRRLGHGTCVQSLVNGPRFGAAKAADIVIVKLPFPANYITISSAFKLVAEDIEARNLRGKAVITMSEGYPGIDIYKSKSSGTQVIKQGLFGKVKELRDYILRLISLDVPLVVSSGNNRQVYKHIDSFPAALGEVIDVITVGAMEPNGARTQYSQGEINEVTVLAVGQVECAKKDSTSQTRQIYGTSFAAPRVAGMIATWLGSEEYRERLHVKGKVVANVKNLLKELAYIKMPASKPDGGFLVAYNGFGKFTCRGYSDPKQAQGRKLC
ncbi:peptidase S8/S53 domain-containing protein [Colletotrichum navitas]|uniref:Peptidase S8/S53 domain-containing protein n=1 Tax=Colletotrichum navitas TaxID=681940 RepID=A0AAD8UU24_9PEZI|nr:peptidase S8/S53 domain-containing protein [Colletotrichum navitas]KAK1561406.1 peptidase S8/S53 domain-containing protein [Colletotrichum navitas]